MSRAAPAPSAIVRIAAGSQRREPRIMILTRRNLGLPQFQPALCDFSPAASAISAMRPPLSATHEFLVIGYASGVSATDPWSLLPDSLLSREITGKFVGPAALITVPASKNSSAQLLPAKFPAQQDRESYVPLQ